MDRAPKRLITYRRILRGIRGKYENLAIDQYLITVEPFQNTGLILKWRSISFDRGSRPQYCG